MIKISLEMRYLTSSFKYIRTTPYSDQRWLSLPEAFYHTFNDNKINPLLCKISLKSILLADGNLRAGVF